MRLEELADILQVELIVRRYPLQKNRWTAAFAGAETKPDSTSSLLYGTYGEETNPTAAIADYVDKIKGRVLVFDAADKNKRREFGVPDNLIY